MPWYTWQHQYHNVIFNAALIRLVAWNRSSLLLKIKWKHNHILYIKIVYKHNMTRSRVHAQRGRGGKKWYYPVISFWFIRAKTMNIIKNNTKKEFENIDMYQRCPMFKNIHHKCGDRSLFGWKSKTPTLSSQKNNRQAIYARDKKTSPTPISPKIISRCT